MTNDGQRSDPSGFQIENEMDLLYGRAHPNPTREGCPPREQLASLSRRELRIGDPAYDHLFKCSPCYREFRALQQAEAARQKAAVSRKRLLYVAAAAVLVLAIAGSWFVLRRPGNTTAPVPTMQAVQIARLDLRPFSVTRSDERTKEPPPLVLSRARLNVTLLLPVGSEPGSYDVQLLDSNLQSRATSTGTATIVDFITTLATTLDTSALPAGSYQLAVRRQGEDWRMFPAQLR
ncbi:MAG TPA: hypothetical protein VFY10_12760 [Dehalococcoidia bacterium]|nr:hypothetical protein [Dehalococcoidia bacterium]